MSLQRINIREKSRISLNANRPSKKWWIPCAIACRFTLAIGPDYAASLTLSCDSLLPGDEGPMNKQTHDSRTSRKEHKRHIIAQGPWHAMSPLSRLLTLSSEDQGQLITSFLRPGQSAWIREQFLRVAVLLHLALAEVSGRKEGCRVLDSVTQGSNMYTKAEFLAREVRKGAIFMSGP